MTDFDALDAFLRRIEDDWLPAYCAHPRRQYSPSGFRYDSIKLHPVDARDCMRAIDSGVVKDVDHGRYRAALGRATEPLFWEGSRLTVPRSITFWHEPAITFAALARLHFDYGWPIGLLGNQPRSWAFDLSAHDPRDPQRYRILGEVKKSKREAERLVSDFQRASEFQSTQGLSQNSTRKWLALRRERPPVLWIIGPAGCSWVFACDYPSSDVALVRAEDAAALQFAAA